MFDLANSAQNFLRKKKMKACFTGGLCMLLRSWRFVDQFKLYNCHLLLPNYNLKGEGEEFHTETKQTFSLKLKKKIEKKVFNILNPKQKSNKNKQ